LQSLAYPTWRNSGSAGMATLVKGQLRKHLKNPDPIASLAAAIGSVL